MKMVLRHSFRLFLGAWILTGCSGGSDQFSRLLDSPSGGTGNASISISSFSPGSTSVAVKETASQAFFVAASGQGTLLYTWTVDGVEVGTNAGSFNFDATQYSIGVHDLKITISDEVGTVNQTWSVKVNGSPAIDSSLPAPAEVNLRRLTNQSYSVTVSDPNNDTLTYVWKLDGQENILTSTSASESWTPATTEIGTHVVSVDIYDGPASDAGTYKVTRSWTTYVNNFSDSCNKMDNLGETNKSCVLVGIAGIGDGLDPSTNPSKFYVRPSSLIATAAGNQFIGDDANDVVWFYNLHTSPSITVLGVTVPVNTMKVVAGVGMASSGNSASSKALRNFLNAPDGLYWDGSNLYIADTSNNRVLKVDANGDVSTVISSGCNSPRSMTMVGTDLYIACYSSHVVKKVDTLTLTATTFAGTGSAGNPANTNQSSFTDASNGPLNGPYAITSDASGNIYVGEYTGCRVRFYNQSASTVTFYGSYTVGIGMQRIILGGAGSPTCSLVTGEPVNLTAATDAHVSNIRSVRISSSGLLLIAHDLDTISAINFSASSATYFGVAINGYEARSMIGSTAGYVGEGQLPTSTRFNNVYDVSEDLATGDLFVADYANLRLRKVRASDSRTELVAGNGSSRAQTNAGQGQLEAGLEKMNSVRGLAYDPLTGEIFVADSGNNRIRVINRYGQVSQAVGTGTAGTGAEENDYPSNVTMSQPRGLVLTQATATFGGNLVWADSQNHRIRIWNRGTTTATLFGVVVDGGHVATIGGDGSSGNLTSGSALQSAFNNPSGVAFDGTDLYVSDTNNHCIKKIDSTGELSAVAGTCGTSGNVNGPVGTGRMSYPEGISYYEYGVHKGLVIAARNNSRIKFHRFAGTSLLFGGSTAIGDTNNIACGGTFHTENINANLAICSQSYDVTTVNGKVCFSNYTYHNVRCIAPTGEINTVFGGPEGIDDVTPLYGPGGSFAAEDYDSLNPNAASQNGVAATYLPDPPTGEPSLTESYGKIAFPMSVLPLDSSTLLVGQYQMGLIFKVKMP